MGFCLLARGWREMESSEFTGKPYYGAVYAVYVDTPPYAGQPAYNTILVRRIGSKWKIAYETFDNKDADDLKAGRHRYYGPVHSANVPREVKALVEGFKLKREREHQQKKEAVTFDGIAGISEGCKTPGMKIRSGGKGRGLARGKGKGPIGAPWKESVFDEMAGLTEVWGMGHSDAHSFEKKPSNLADAAGLVAAYFRGPMAHFRENFDNAKKGVSPSGPLGQKVPSPLELIQIGIKDLRKATTNLNAALSIIEREAKKIKMEKA